MGSKRRFVGRHLFGSGVILNSERASPGVEKRKYQKNQRPGRDERPGRWYCQFRIFAPTHRENRCGDNETFPNVKSTRFR